jgi:hypothetical protein
MYSSGWLFLYMNIDGLVIEVRDESQDGREIDSLDQWVLQLIVEYMLQKR